MAENYDKESYLKHLSEEVYSIRYRERSTGKVFEVNPCIDDVYFDNMYRNGFCTGEYILVSGELPDKWK